MQNQKQSPWSGRMNVPAGKHIVLKADAQTYESLCLRPFLDLRLFCAQGSSVLLSLRNADVEGSDADRRDAGIISIGVSLEELLKSIDRDIEIVFNCREYRESSVFRIVAVSPERWLGPREPLAEEIL